MMRIFGILLVVIVLSGCSAAMPVREEAVIPPDKTISLADSTYTSSNWLESEKYYSILVQSGPPQALYWYRLGNIYAFTERPDAAIVAYREAIKLEPDSADTWYNLGMVQLRQAVYTFGQLQLHPGENQRTAEQGEKILKRLLELIQPKEEE